jgi:hypothetical protein
VGVHGRNDYWECKFEERDYQLIREARIEHVKMMISDQAGVNPQVLTNAVEVCNRLVGINSEMDLVVRLDDPHRVRFHPELKVPVHPTPQEFANTFIPIMKGLQNGLGARWPYVVKFEVLNEPNHNDGGWGPGVDQARNFSTWFCEACKLLKDACPWAKLGFPGLAVGLLEEDLGWAEACRPAVERADWLGVHCYWQNPDYTYRNHMHDQWGLRFEVFHDLFPDKIIEITEFGNSNGQTPGLPVDQERIAQEYVEYYQKLFEYPYINSAAAFIMSSREGPWEEQGFTWRKESGEFFPVVERVGTMPRPNLVAAVAVPPVVAVAMPPVAPVDERYFPETKRTVKGAFLQAFTRYGLEVCGYPITEQFIEAGVPSQYFERVAMEEYERGKVRLKAVSDEVLRARQMVAQLQREAQSLRQQATASQTAIAQLQREAQSLRQQATASQTTIAQLQREAQGLHQQAVASQTTIAQLQREALELRQQAAVSQETITQLRGQVETLRQQLVAATTTTPTTPPVTTPVVPPPPAIPPAITAPPMEDVTARLRRHPVKRFDRRTLNQIEYLVMQHSVLPGDFPPGKIADYLVEKRQWPGIGYHFYITSDGKIYQTNDLETVCYFAGSNVEHNPRGVCICFAGNFTDEVPTEAQLSSGGKLLASLLQELHLPVESIRGHKEFVITQSPGNQWDGGRRWKDMLLAEVKAAQS